MLTTTVIGSWSVPDWLERAKTAVYHGGISRSQLADMHDMAIKAALKDQEMAGIDVVTDGELRRDNDVDYILARVPGVVAREPVKAFYFDYLDLELPARIAGRRARAARASPATSRSRAPTPSGPCGSR